MHFLPLFLLTLVSLVVAYDPYIHSNVSTCLTSSDADRIVADYICLYEDTNKTAVHELADRLIADGVEIYSDAINNLNGRPVSNWRQSVDKATNGQSWEVKPWLGKTHSSIC